MTTEVDVAIVGAGMVGLALAARLHRDDDQLRLAIVDAGQSPEFDDAADIGLRVSALSPGSVALLESCGVWSAIGRTRMGTYSAMCVWDANGSADDAAAIRFGADELGLGSLGYIVENELIRYRLYEALRDNDERRSAIDWYWGRRLANIEPGRRANRLVLDDDSCLCARLVVGADGARSAVRDLTGLPVRTRRYPQDAVVTHVQPERTHADTAWQRFLATGPVALLPLGDGRCSVVWSNETDACGELMELDEETLAARLTDATDRVLGRLAIAGPRGSFPLSASYAPDYVGPRTVLVGDAAHSVHPLAGQGVNLGFSDAAELSECIVAACRRGEDPGDRPVLRRYERARKAENMRTLIFLDALQRLFAVDTSAAARLRMGGMRLFNRIAPLKRMAVRHATGRAQTA